MTTPKKEISILLVDDDRFLLDMYLLKFKKSGLNVETSSSSSDALKKLEEGKQYDIILLDIIMPGMDGLEFLAMLRQKKMAEGSVIIMLTNQADDMDRAKALGVAGYIVKATTVPSEVVEKVLSIYNSKHPDEH